MQLSHRKMHEHDFVGIGINLRDTRPVFVAFDHDVFVQRGLALVDNGDNRGVEFVLDGEHMVRLAFPAPDASGHRSGVLSAGSIRVSNRGSSKGDTRHFGFTKQQSRFGQGFGDNPQNGAF